MRGIAAVRKLDEAAAHIYVGSRDSDLPRIAMEMGVLLLCLKEETRVTFVRRKADSSSGGKVMLTRGTVGGPPIKPAGDGSEPSPFQPSRRREVVTRPS